MSETTGVLELLEAKLRDNLALRMPPSEAERVMLALEFARTAHQGQRRRSGEPYLTHCIEVALILLDLLRSHTDAPILQAALLHDTIEDNDAVEFRDVAREFGEEVAHLVDGVTKIGGIPFRNPEAEQSENFRKMLLSMSRDIRVILIKLADRLHNMRTLDHMKPEKQVEIATETREIYAPLAHRLGIAKFKWELEDLSFKYGDPESYRKVGELVATKRAEREQAVEAIRQPLVTRLQEDGIDAEVSGRAKSFFSIWSKMERLGGRFDQIFDLLGVRVLTDSRGDCYRALGAVHDLFVPVQDRFKDYIATPKSNMYQSLHTTVVGPQRRMVEVQIRTRQMHMIAEIGIAAHYRYKDGGRVDAEIERKLGDMVVPRTTEWQEEAVDPNEFMDFLRTSLYQDEVFVFTPANELKRLPKGATPVDFAYAVHTAVGSHCVGARVDGRIVPLKYQLKSGDTVEILTSPSATPSEGWLQFVRSSKARSKVRHWIKTQRLTESISLGREMIQRELKKSRRKMPDEAELVNVAQSFGLSDSALLLAKVGEGLVSAIHVVHRIYPELTKPKEASPVEKIRQLASRPVRGVRINDISSLMIRMAQCCHPVPGDQVVGVVTRGRGISVHRTDCPNVFEDRVEAERRLDVQWDVDRGKLFLVRLVIYGIDRSSMLADVAQAVSKTKTNIKQATMGSEENKARGDFTIEVENLSHLSRVMRAIRSVKGVTDVVRKDMLPYDPENEEEV